ncbi:hypothetical protein R3P38DRAFT_3058021, partial [Favolaschia claudopus]
MIHPRALPGLALSRLERYTGPSDFRVTSSRSNNGGEIPPSVLVLCFGSHTALLRSSSAWICAARRSAPGVLPPPGTRIVPRPGSAVDNDGPWNGSKPPVSPHLQIRNTSSTAPITPYINNAFTMYGGLDVCVQRYDADQVLISDLRVRRLKHDGVGPGSSAQQAGFSVTPTVMRCDHRSWPLMATLTTRLPLSLCKRCAAASQAARDEEPLGTRSGP